jgi:uncharacterized protein YdhG (YjbR/CyaY superfamily)
MPKDATKDAEECAAAIAALEHPDRQMAEALHALVSTNAPMLLARTFYGMPAYYLGDKNVLFFQSGIKYKTRYCTLGFSQAAHLDKGEIWPTSYAIIAWSSAVEGQIRELILRAVQAD